MNFKTKLIISVLLSTACSFTGCNSESTSNSCDLTEEICQTLNETLDEDKCECTDASPQKCYLTQADCDKDGKTLDADHCACVIASECSYNGNVLTTGQKVCDADGKVVTCKVDGTTASQACDRGVCVDGNCIPRDCDNIFSGQTTCKDLKLMVCDDGQLVEAKPGCAANEKCLDGQNQCSNYRSCGSIAHNANGCLNGDIVSCNDGKTTVVEDCSSDEVCTASANAKGSFVCKKPASTDCEWNGGLVSKGQSVCDGNVLKTCSSENDGKFDAGIDCSRTNNPYQPICDTDSCREEKYCGPNKDIKPGEIVCNAAGTNQAKCVDGTLVDETDVYACQAPENASPICVSYEESGLTYYYCTHKCNKGYVDFNGECVPKPVCEPYKEMYYEYENICICNYEAHWVGYTGECECETGYDQVGNRCTKSCNGDETKVYDPISDSCVCNAEDHFTELNGHCICETGYKLNPEGAGFCELMKTCDPYKETYDYSNNECKCNTSKHWTGIAGKCHCDDVSVFLNNKCQLKKTCDAVKETYNAENNTCSCNTADHWVGKAGSCACESGYVPINGTCQLKVTCQPNKETYNEKANTCECNVANHWTGTSGHCVCENYYTDINGVCTPPDFVRGDKITFGHYEQDNNLTNGKEPISWIIVAKDEHTYYLITEKVIEVLPICQPNEPNAICSSWEKSTLRSWLNGLGSSNNMSKLDYTSDNFINTAFTPDEQAKLVKETQVADNSRLCAECHGGGDTYDKIWILSLTEVELLLKDNMTADATPYVVSKGVKSNQQTSDVLCLTSNTHCIPYIWTRTPGNGWINSSTITPLNTIYECGFNNTDPNIGVRPVIRIQL